MDDGKTLLKNDPVYILYKGVTSLVKISILVVEGNGYGIGGLYVQPNQFVMDRMPGLVGIHMIPYGSTNGNTLVRFFGRRSRIFLVMNIPPLVIGLQVSFLVFIWLGVRVILQSSSRIKGQRRGSRHFPFSREFHYFYTRL